MVIIDFFLSPHVLYCPVIYFNLYIYFSKVVKNHQVRVQFLQSSELCSYSLPYLKPSTFLWVQENGQDSTLEDHRPDDDGQEACQHDAQLEEEEEEGEELKVR